MQAIISLLELLNFKHRHRDEVIDNKIICDESDILYLACASDLAVLKELNNDIIDKADDFLCGTEFHEKVMKDFYEEYLGKIGKKYPEDFNELRKIAIQER